MHGSVQRAERPQKRQIYDTYGHEALQASARQPDFNGTIFQDFHDIFGEFFGFEEYLARAAAGAAAAETRVQRGADLRYDMTLTFEEASAGITTKIRVPRQEYCEILQWYGRKEGHWRRGVPDLRRPRPDDLSAGIFHDQSHVPGVPGRGTDR